MGGCQGSHSRTAGRLFSLLIPFRGVCALGYLLAQSPLVVYGDFVTSNIIAKLAKLVGCKRACPCCLAVVASDGCEVSSCSVRKVPGGAGRGSISLLTGGSISRYDACCMEFSCRLRGGFLQQVLTKQILAAP